jgi:hypothetical protein
MELLESETMPPGGEERCDRRCMVISVVTECRADKRVNDSGAKPDTTHPGITAVGDVERAAFECKALRIPNPGQYVANFGSQTSDGRSSKTAIAFAAKWAAKCDNRCTFHDLLLEYSHQSGDAPAARA